MEATHYFAKNRALFLLRQFLAFCLPCLIVLSASSSLAEFQTIEELANNLAAAFKAKDKVAIKNLIDWEQVDSFTLQSVESSIDFDLLNTFERVTIEPLAPDFKAEYSLNGKIYIPNRKPVSRLVVHFSGAGGMNTAFLLGEKNGSYKIATAIPK